MVILTLFQCLRLLKPYFLVRYLCKLLLYVSLMNSDNHAKNSYENIGPISVVAVVRNVILIDVIFFLFGVVKVFELRRT